MLETNSLLKKMGKERKAVGIYPAFPERTVTTQLTRRFLEKHPADRYREVGKVKAALDSPGPLVKGNILEKAPRRHAGKPSEDVLLLKSEPDMGQSLCPLRARRKYWHRRIARQPGDPAHWSQDVVHSTR